VNVNIPAQKTGTLQMGPKAQNGEFLKNGCYDYNQISVIIYGDNLPK
jgi:hypothetical protein